MLKKCLTLVWLTVFSAVLVCCGSSDENIFDAPVHKANAEKTCTMSGISVPPLRQAFLTQSSFRSR